MVQSRKRPSGAPAFAVVGKSVDEPEHGMVFKNSRTAGNIISEAAAPAGRSMRTAAADLPHAAGWRVYALRSYETGVSADEQTHADRSHEGTILEKGA